MNHNTESELEGLISKQKQMQASEFVIYPGEEIEMIK